MPKSYNRDIIVVSAKALMDENSFQHEVEVLKELLYKVEDVFNVATSAEIIDLNTFRVKKSKFHVVRNLCEKEPKPFVFIVNKN